MKKIIAILLGAALPFLMAGAQEVLRVYRTDGTSTGLALNTLDSLSFSDDGNEALFHLGTSTIGLPIAGIDSLSFEEMPPATVYVHYDGVTASVLNPLVESGVEVTVEGADVTVNSTTGEEVEYVLTGTTTDGTFKLYGEKKFILTLCGVSLTHSDGPAINIQTGKKATVRLVEGTVNTLADGDTYAEVEGEDMKATLFSEGQLVFTGGGTLCVAGHRKHAICSDDYVEIESGNFVLKDIVSDGIHANDCILVNGGTLEIEASSDGMDGDAGYIEINGGTLDITVTEDTAKGIKCDGTLAINGGDITIRTSGNTVVESGDPSYCTAIKSDTDMTILDGRITITATGLAGRGISTDGTLTIGDEEHCPVITVKTSGRQITVSGSGMNADYAGPKAIKSDGDLTVNNGQISITTAQDGGEGMESKSTLSVHGGTLEMETYDDCINAANRIVIDGGRIYCNASNNDGIDSNGTIAIAGGLVVSSGTNTPEEGVDCDQNNFAITGGVLIATGGATSTPTSSSCTQRCVVYNTSGMSGKLVRVQDASGNGVLTYRCPTKSSLGSSVVMLMSSDKLAASTTYYIYTGGSVTGGEEFHGYYTDAVYTAGTQATSFTTSSMVTTVGSGGGGFGPGGGGGRPPR